MKNTNKSKSVRFARAKQLPVFQKIINLPYFSRLYVLFSLLVLLATTILWSLLSAKVEQSNADQIINSFLFQHYNTLHNALIPGQHSFLIKWPLFYLIGLIGPSAGLITAFTVGLVIVTVAALVGMLYGIERRPLVFGSLCLALASVLLMIPTQPYAGGLLPVNMAMLTTRNIEYILYIASLLLLIRAPKIKSWKFILAVIALAILFASDKLFLNISLGGALIALICYALAKNWRLVNLSVTWLMGSLLGGAGAFFILWFINATKLTHIVNGSTTGPYSIIHSSHNLVLGCIYAVFAVMTNFGANPMANDTILRNVPSQLYHGLVSLSGVTYLINILMLLAGLFLIFRFVRSTMKPTKDSLKLTSSYCLSIILIWTFVAATIVFVATNHAYAVDARYLTIILFGIFILAATHLRSKRFLPENVVLIGLLLTIGIILGLSNTVHSYHNDESALSETNRRDSTIIQVLDHRPMDALIGNYWRVVPAKLQSPGNLNIIPLSNCTQPLASLNSTAWEVNLHNHSFVYLLTLDKNLTNFPNCSIKQVITTYGRPNASTLIAGTLANPKELLLFYDHGIPHTPTSVLSKSKEPSTILPTTLTNLSNTICPNPTVMNIVAHEDDDLLFMNPDLIHSINAGDCIRTIYLTAGDDGQGQFYWLNREEGAEAAYSYMIGSNVVWIQKIVELNSHEFITIANPKDNHHISLIFMHLPDGDIKGQGFADTDYQSLVKLESGNIKVMTSVDKQSHYSASQLVAALTSLMHAYQPSVIRTQANYVSKQYPDHSDHIAVGAFVQMAYKQYEQQQYGDQVTIPLEFYIGYPIHGMPANVSGTDLAKKEATFLQYAKFDGATCQTVQECLQTPTYNAYLTREYQYKS